MLSAPNSLLVCLGDNRVSNDSAHSDGWSRRQPTSISKQYWLASIFRLNIGDRPEWKVKHCLSPNRAIHPCMRHTSPSQPPFCLVGLTRRARCCILTHIPHQLSCFLTTFFRRSNFAKFSAAVQRFSGRSHSVVVYLYYVV